MGWLVIASASPRAPVLCRGDALVGLPADGGGGWWVDGGGFLANEIREPPALRAGERAAGREGVE